MSTERRIEVEGDNNEWPTERWSPLAPRNEQGYGQWPEAPSNPAGAVTAPDEHSLQLFNASASGTAKVRNVAGVVGGGTAAATLLTVADGDVIWIQWPVSYDTGSGDWKPTGSTRTVSRGVALPAESNSLAVCPLGSVVVSGGTVTDIKLADGGGTSTQDRYGPVFWQRPGGPTSYASDFISPGP